MRPRPRAVISWSSGKDSAYALHVAQQAGELEVVGALTTITSAYGRVSMHGVREALLDRQLEQLGLRGYKVAIPAPCSNEEYERAMGAACAQLRSDGITHIIFGDLFLEDIRAYREQRLAGTGLTPVFPLWQLDTAALAREMVDAGMQAIVACLDPKRVDPALAGRRYDHALLDALPPDVDPCAERGEFHTAVVGGPMFRAPIDVSVGEIVTRDGFVFADLVPA